MSSSRVRFLDILRGVAVCGIFPVNLPYFAMAVTRVDAPSADLPLVDVVAYEVTQGFFTFKFITIFSFLFGIGIVLLRRKCEREGLPVPQVFILRYGALFGFGLAHVVFLWYGDILLFYAGLGLLTFWLATAPPKVLVALAVVLLLAPVLLLGIFLAIPGFPEAIQEQSALWQELDAEEQRALATGPWDEFGAGLLEFHPAFESAVYAEAGFVRQVLLRCTTWIFYALTAGLLIIIPRAGGMFLLGIAAARSGWILDPSGRRNAFRRAAILGFGLGVPLQVWTLAVSRGEPSASGEIWMMVALYLGSLGTMFGYVGILGLLCGGAAPPRFLRPFEAVGRMAFTNYIGQSVIAATLFYSWGIGLHGEVGFAGLYLVVVAVWALQLTASTLWLRRFRQGPLEALWRRITYMGTSGEGTRFDAPESAGAGGS